jgi:cholesterol transport system auxiliary component
MYNLKKAAVLVLGISLLICACVNLKQPSFKTEYYTLEYVPPLFTGMDQLPYIIKVERFSVAPIYNTTQIIYSERSFKRDAYVYHKWRVNPGDMVTYLLNRDIRYSGLFKTVIPYGSQFKSMFLLGGEVEEFFELDTKEEWNAVLSISISLMAGNEEDIKKRVLLQKSYNTTEVCKQKNPGALVEAISLGMSRLSREIIGDIYNCLSN